MGRSRGGLTTKIHALVDAEGLPIMLKLTEGQAHDGNSARARGKGSADHARFIAIATIRRAGRLIAGPSAARSLSNQQIDETQHDAGHSSDT